ncbi:MAG TPA: LacI family DNA-binding transcriptional regulator [Amycolatopsis sp.]|uniref:LacI family DNA-binding transcriptional regulator n=1 Tax=Amycolatopsis sp. TaxID=37632 RepID=UPI002B489D10|nr:LacI family DNA-binding transcriptional regulator [Amycolatopsis sp.]HKS49135.1 LacI family DNA-binding transcriptional regulator [Amycolatopsis sp.]
MTVTIHDVARRAGVSISTVSRAFTSPDLVKRQTRDRVLAAATELGYHATSAPHRVPAVRTGHIGIVVSELGNPFFTGVLNGVQARARQHDIAVLFANSDEDPAAEQNIVRRMAGQVDGIVLCSPSMTDDQVRALTEQTTLVLLNREVPGVGSIVMDSADGMRQAIQHLAALGHHRCAYLGGPRTSWSNKARKRGLAEAAERHGIEIVEFGPFPPMFEGGLQGADLALAADVTAIVAYNDLVAFGALARLNARGVPVPDEVSLVGFDDLVFAAISAPPLTTIAMPTEAAGRAAVTVLLGLLDGEADDDITQVLDTYLIVRATTAPPPPSR